MMVLCVMTLCMVDCTLTLNFQRNVLSLSILKMETSCSFETESMLCVITNKTRLILLLCWYSIQMKFCSIVYYPPDLCVCVCVFFYYMWATSFLFLPFMVLERCAFGNTSTVNLAVSVSLSLFPFPYFMHSVCGTLHILLPSSGR